MTIAGIKPFCDGIFNVMPFLFTTHPDGLKSQAVSCLSVLSSSSIFVCLCTSLPSARSPPSASSATVETPEQRVQRLRNENQARRMQAISMIYPVCRRVPLFFTPSGRPRSVVEVAKELVGHFLICRESNVAMSIVETEAYQEHEEIYRNRFPRPPPDFRSPAGCLVSCRIANGQQFMFITAGDDNSGDVVLLRTCSGICGHREIARRVNLVPPAFEYYIVNMMSGPTKVAMGLAPDLESYCNLLTPSRGLYLLRKPPHPLVMLEGPRILPKDCPSITYSTMRGADSRFRFTFQGCHQKILLITRLRRIANQP